MRAHTKIEHELQSVYAEPVDLDVDDLADRIGRAARRKRRSGLALRSVGVVATAGVVAAAVAGIPWHGPLAPGGPGATDDTTETSPAVADTPSDPAPTQTPPYQPTSPEQLLDRDPDQGNPWDIPDPRPTGLPELDDLGVQVWTSGDSVSPVPGLRCPDLLNSSAYPETEGNPSPEAAVGWSHGDLAADDRWVGIHVTGWTDPEAALEIITACDWEGLGELPVAQTDTDLQAGQLGDLTPWLYGEYADEVMEPGLNGPASYALVHVGTYLIGVTVIDSGSDADRLQLATTIAQQTAANLAFLDPART